MLCPPTSPGNDFFQCSVSRSNRSRKSRSINGAGIVKCGGPAALGANREAAENLVQKGFRGFALGVGIEIENDPVPQYGRRHLLYIVHTQMDASRHQREYATTFQQRLRAAR